jgi:xylulokinase
MYLLGYDIGSSHIKAALLDTNKNKTVAVVNYPEQEMDILSRQSGWAEQQPEVWWHNVVSATRKLLSTTGVEPKNIKGIGISYQMHSLVLVDKDLHVLRPSIIWCDSRGVEIGKRAFDEIGHNECFSQCLNSPGNFTASKMKWVKDNEPDIYDKIYKFMLPGDFIAMRLTGELNITIGGLSEGIMWNFEEKKVSKSVLDYYGIDEDLIPDIVPTFGDQGIVSKEASEMTGLAIGTPVTFRAGDQPTNALALNVLRPNEIAATSGTSGVVYGVVDKPLYDARSRVNSFAHINYEENYDRIGVLLCLNGAGIQYSWMKHQVARSDRNYSDMERMVSTVPIGSDGLAILPFGNGAERLLENQNVKSHIHGIQFNRHTRAHLYRAGLEGVAFSFVKGVGVLKEMGLNVDVMRVGNDNMFQSEVFSSTIATLLDCHIEVVDTTGAIGAARASGVVPGVYGSIEDAMKEVSPIIVHEPKFNKTKCVQAYNFWDSCLDSALIPDPKKYAQAEIKQEMDQMQVKIDEKGKELTSLHLQLQAKEDFLSEIKAELKGLGDGKDAALKLKYDKLIRKIDNNLDNVSQWNEFEKHFEMVHSEFFKSLKISFPELSTSEIKLSALLKMKMTTKDIAKQLNLSVRGVETRRYRLRKKLNLSKQIGLEDFLDSV